MKVLKEAAQRSACALSILLDTYKLEQDWHRVLACTATGTLPEL